MTQWIYFPKSDLPPDLATQIVSSFQSVEDQIRSDTNNLTSDQVLAIASEGLQSLGFDVETGKKASERIRVPVLFGGNGLPEKTFDADAYDSKKGWVIEVEAGRGLTNFQFLKDLFQACMMHDVFYLAIVLRMTYNRSNDYDRVVKFFDTMYASNRLQLPLKGILILGY